MLTLRSCCLCIKKAEGENGKLFNVPRDVEKRKKWSAISNKELSASDRICDKHFSPSDIRKSAHRVQLKPNAVPLAPTDNCTNQNETIKIEIEDSVSTISMEINAIKVTMEKTQDCRCCTNPSGTFIQLDECIKTSEGGVERSYKNLLYEIIKLNISMYHDNMMPQQICQKCAVQVETSHKFIQQISEVSQQYIKTAELSQKRAVTLEKQSDEPFSIEDEIEIKEEQIESGIYISPIRIKEASQEERDSSPLSGSDKNSQETDKRSDDPVSVKDLKADLNDASLARSCDICHNVYRNAKALKIHRRYTHLSEEDKLPCPHCSYRANRNSALKVHMAALHGHDKVNEHFKPAPVKRKKYPCNLCSLSFESRRTLRNHAEEKHSQSKEKKRHLCTVCGNTYTTKWSLDLHTLSHTGVRPISCEICHMGFKRQKELRSHMLKHSDDKPHQCSDCGKRFKCSYKLKSHIRFVHSDVRPFKCSECEKSFKYACVLRTHMHIHTGQKPFECQTCGEAFSLRTSLNNHCLKTGHVK